MGYIGAEPATSFETVRKDRFTSQTGTTVTLSHTVSSINDIVVWVNSVKQDYTNYSVSGTTLTLGGSLVSADIVEVAYIGRTFQTVAPDTNMVTNAMMADDSIDSAEIVDGSVDTAHIGASQVTTAKIAADAIDGTKIADDAINSEHYTDGSIDTAHIADDQVTLAKMAGLARGKIIYGDASGNPAALTVGSNTQVLKSDGTDISWGAAGGFTVSDITGATALGATPADTDEFVLSDAGTLKRVDYSHLKSLFGKVGFSARRDSSAITLNHATVTDVVFNTEIKDTDSAYNESTGVFTAPVTGFYFIGCTWSFRDAQGNMADHQMNISIGGSMYQVHRTENTSNGALFTALGGSWASIMGTISSGTAIKMQCRIETNDSSAGELSHSDYNSTFWGWNLA